MAVRKSRGKVVDKWKTKRWYTVIAPKVFEMKEIGEVVSSDPKNVINRIVPITLYSLVPKRVPQYRYTTIDFRITDVHGEKAYTKIVGMELSNNYISTFVRNGCSALDMVYNKRLKDNQSVVFKLFVVTGSRVSENTKRNIRAEVRNYLDDYTKSKSYDEFLDDVVNDKFIPALHARLSKITNIYRSVLKKFELVESFK